MEKIKTYQNSSHHWVTFKDGRPKIKLRKYLAILTLRVYRLKLDNKTQSEIRETFIKAYDDSGLDGLNILYISCVEAYKALLQKQLDAIQARKEANKTNL